MKKVIVKIFILFTFFLFNLYAQVECNIDNYNYYSTLFSRYELKQNWSSINSLLHDQAPLGIRFNNFMWKKVYNYKNIVLDDTLRLTLFLYTGGETGDPLYHKYTRPFENIPNKNKIVPSFNLSLSRKWNSLSLLTNIDFQGYFITGSNKIDNQIYQLDPILMDKNNLELKLDGKIQYQNIFLEWDLKNMNGWGSLPFEENLTYSKNKSLLIGLGFETNLTENKIIYETYSYEIVKPTKNLYNTFNLQLKGKVEILKNKQNNYLINYNLGKIVSDSQIKDENKNELNNNLYYSLDYAGLIDFGRNFRLKGILGYKKNNLGNKGLKLNLSLNRKELNSDYQIAFIFEPVEYKYEKYYFDYKWEFKELSFLNKYQKPSLGNYLTQINFVYAYIEEKLNLNIIGNYTNINNYYLHKYRVDEKTLIRYYDELKDEKFGELSFDIEYKIVDFNIKTGIRQKFSNLDEIPKTMFFSMLEYKNKLGMNIKLEYYYYSETKWDKVFSNYSDIYDYKLDDKNIFNLIFKQNLEKINLKGFDVGFMIYNLFDKKNQYLPLSTSIGRTIVVFIKSDLKLNL